MGRSHTFLAKCVHWAFVILYAYGIFKQLDDLEQLEDSSLGAARDDRSTRVHGAAASRAELGRAARGERIRALFSALRAWPP